MIGWTLHPRRPAGILEDFMRRFRATDAMLFGAAAAMALAISVATPVKVQATPAIAKQTKQPCAKCHTSPPALNDYGKKYKAGGK